MYKTPPTLIELLTSFDITQPVGLPAHCLGSTLDLVVTFAD